MKMGCFFQKWGIAIIISAGLLSGCCYKCPTPEAINAAVMQAQKMLDDAKVIANTMDEPEKYAKDLQETQNELGELKKKWDSMNRKSAMDAALSVQQRAKKTNLDACNALAHEAENLKEDLLKSHGKDSAVAKANIPLLEKIIGEYKNREDTADPKEVIEAKTMIESGKEDKDTLETDVGFGSGSYDLAEKGKQRIDMFFQEKIAKKVERLNNLNAPTKTLKVRIFGYTDQQGFSSKTENNLKRACNSASSNDSSRRRQHFNLCLSKLRAKTIREHIERLLTERNINYPWIQVEDIGKGEEMPSEVQNTPPYPTEDPRRRVCKISCGGF